jgi:hypothetical protein
MEEMVTLAQGEAVLMGGMEEMAALEAEGVERGMLITLEMVEPVVLEVEEAVLVFPVDKVALEVAQVGLYQVP